jgi:hypothetical protein
MRSFLVAGIMVVAAVLMLSCSTTYSVYKTDMFEGRKLLNQEEYALARDTFVKASTEEKRAAPFAYAATASYMMHDLRAAERSIKEAENAPGRSFFVMRILGYKALILLNEGKKNEGLSALKEYVIYYGYLYPLMSIDDVKAMQESGTIDLPRLEKLIEEQVVTYEREVEQAVTTGTGFYSRGGRGGAYLMQD